MNTGWRTPILLMIVAMTAGALIVKVMSSQDEGSVTVLSLREIAPPAGPPLFAVDSSPYARYLRTGIATEYDGKDWNLRKIREVEDAIDRAAEAGTPLVPDGLYLARSYRDFNRDLTNSLAVLDGPEFTQLPDTITERVKNLSRRITQGMITPFEKAKAIETYLQVKYDYDLDYEPAPSGWEPNDWFLFEERQGICGNFNSAFVVLARAADLPARLAYGYYLLPGDGEPQSVYSTNAHAWAEVGFEGLGWTAFEATPP